MGVLPLKTKYQIKFHSKIPQTLEKKKEGNLGVKKGGRFW